MGPVLEATGYIWVAILSFFILKEKITTKKLIGLVGIIAGIVVYSL
jgi:multidrug transporter EmrE-like cation transporter